MFWRHQMLIKMNPCKKILLIILMLVNLHAFGENASLLLKSRLTSILTMTGDFKQIVSAHKKQVSSSEGIMAMAKPNLFRWETRTPMEQLVLADGKKLWIYDVELEQVNVKSQKKNINGVAGLFLAQDTSKIIQDFNILTKNTQNEEIFILKPKSKDNNFQKVVLKFDKKLLKSIDLFDQLGQNTTINLNNVKINPVISQDLFVFKIPKGVDLIEQ